MAKHVVYLQDQMEKTELTTEETTFDYKPGGYNRWASGDSQASYNPFFPAVETDEDDRQETTEGSAVDNTETTSNDAASDAAKPDTDTGAETPDSEDSVEVDNPAYFIAKQLIADGVVEMEDVGKGISFGDIYNNYKEKLAPTIKNEALAEINQTLQQAGITEENIVMLQAIQNGIPVDELYTVSRYEKYGQLSTEDANEKKVEVIKEWYALRNLTPKEIERNLAAIEIDDEVDAEFEQAKGFFNGAVESFKEEQRNATLEKLRQEHLIRQQNQTIIDNAVKLGKIGAEKLTTEQSRQIEADIYKKTETVDFGNGQVAVVSPFELFMYQMNTNLEFQLLQYKNFKYKGITEAVEKEKAKEETTKDFLQEWQNQQKKSSSKASIKRSETTETATEGRTSTGGIRYEI